MAIPTSVVLNVTGPHTIQWSAAGTTSWADLGRTDNDDLFNIEVEHKYMDIFTNEFGQNPADSIQMGAVATLNFTLVSHNPTACISMMNAIAGGGTATTGLAFPTIGQRALADSNLVAIKANSGIAGSPSYIVDYCRLLGTSLKDVGNKPTRVGFRFEIIRTTQTNIYTISQ